MHLCSPSRSLALAAALTPLAPCPRRTRIQASLPFYREILGFTLVGKADKTRATICRGADGDGVGGVEIYLRTAPTGPDGESVRPPPANVWIVVGDVDGEYLVS